MGAGALAPGLAMASLSCVFQWPVTVCPARSVEHCFQVASPVLMFLFSAPLS